MDFEAALEEMLMGADNPAALYGLAQFVMGNGGTIANDGLWAQYASWLRQQLVDGTIKGSISELATVADPINGQQKNKLRPQFTGVSNESGQWEVCPFVAGNPLMYPLVVGEPFTVREGDVEWVQILLLVSCDKCTIDESTIKIGDVELADIRAQEYEIEIVEGQTALGEITLYPQDIAQKNLNLELLKGKKQADRTPQEADEILVDIYFPDGLTKQATQTDEETGQTRTYQTFMTVQIKIEYRLVGDEAWTLAKTLTVTDNTFEAKYKGARWKPAARGVYEVRLTRQTNDASTDTEKSRTVWTAIKALRTGDPLIPYRDADSNIQPMSFIALKIQNTAERQGNLEKISCMPFSNVPVWDGEAFANADSANPAWIALRMLTGPMTRDALDPDTEIDLDSFKAWADWCDAQTPPRRFNYIFDRAQSLEDALRIVAMAGRASIIHDGTKRVAVIDQPQDTVVQLFTPHSMDEEEVQHDSRDLPHLVRAKWVDPDSEWQQVERWYYRDGYDETNATTYESVELPGQTDKDVAYLDAEFYAKVTERRAKTYSFKTNLKGLRLSRGDKIRCGSDVFQRGQFFGRVAAVTVDGSDNVTGCTLDAEVVMAFGNDYAITVWRTAANAEVTADVALIEGNQIELVFPTPIPAAEAIAVNDEYIFGLKGYTGGLFVVDEVTIDQELRCHVTCFDYAPEIYTPGPIPPFESLVTLPLPGDTSVVKPIIEGIFSDERYLVYNAGQLQSRIFVQLRDLGNRVDGYRYRIRPTGGDSWGTLHDVQGSTGFFIAGVEDGVMYDIQVQSLFVGRASVFVDATHTVIGKLSKPPDVPVLRFNRETNKLQWLYDVSVGVAIPLDYDGVQISMTQGKAANDLFGTIIAPRALGSEYDVSLHANGVKTFGVRARDTGGRLSENATLITIDFGAAADTEFIAKMDLDLEIGAAWVSFPLEWTHEYDPYIEIDGSYTAGTVITVSATASLESGFGGTYPSTFTPPLSTDFFGDLGQAFFGPGLEDFFEDKYQAQNIVIPIKAKRTSAYSWPDAIPAGATWVPPVTQVIDGEHMIEYYLRDQSAFFGGTEFFDGGETAYFFGVGTWRPMPASGIPVKKRYEYMRIRTPAGRKKITITRLGYKMVAPLVTEYLDDIVVPVDGMALPITNLYSKITYVYAEKQTNATYSTALVADVAKPYDTAGPYVIVRDKDGASVAGEFDFVITGYGGSVS